jgi:hypothetical protein
LITQCDFGFLRLEIVKKAKQEIMKTKPRGLPIVHNQLKRKKREANVATMCDDVWL